MSVIVYLDKARIQPALDDMWHRVARIDFTTNTLTTLCGEEEPIEYDQFEHRPPLKTCWDCDLAYRRAMRIKVGDSHPALLARRKPTPPPDDAA